MEVVNVNSLACKNEEAIYFKREENDFREMLIEFCIHYHFKDIWIKRKCFHLKKMII